jgi:hypothetical protein
VSERDEERETILAMLVNAARERDTFTVGSAMLKNSRGATVFIDASRIDAVIDAIRARKELSFSS